MKIKGDRGLSFESVNTVFYEPSNGTNGASGQTGNGDGGCGGTENCKSCGSSGGCVGWGGNGGPSIATLQYQSGNMTLIDNVFLLGPVGTGGESRGHNGADGIRTEVRQF